MNDKDEIISSIEESIQYFKKRIGENNPFDEDNIELFKRRIRALKIYRNELLKRSL